MRREGFRLETPYEPRGDQPAAIDKLIQGVGEGRAAQVLLGITGSGKTFTMANVVAQLQRPALVIAHNKTLAAQLYQEFKGFFPENAVEYFVSYYDYYQPEAYLPRTDTYIEKDMSINERIDKMRLSATRSLLERRDVLIVASVSCIYGLGMPEVYAQLRMQIEVGKAFRRDELLLHLVEMHYERSLDLRRGTFRSQGEVLDIYPAYEEDLAIRIEFFDDEVERIREINPLTGAPLRELQTFTLYPASHHVTTDELRERAFSTIQKELEERLAHFEAEKKYLERERIEQRTLFDLEMIREMGRCKGIENYSRHFSGRLAGDPPSCLLDYLPEDALIFIDESHQTLPQLRAMFAGDRARKETLIEYGFRLPSAFDNRPLKFEEVWSRIGQVIFVSATPGEWELEEAEGVVVEQIVRPTGLLDPPIEIRKASTQVEDILEEIRQTKERGERVLVTTLTKRLSEELTGYLLDLGIAAKYLHSDIATLERMKIIQDLRLGLFDVLVGINLLREGLDIPEVGLVAILDADREGFLRSSTSLIQTCGRAARNAKGRVIMYADRETPPILHCLKETERRRAIQKRYNEEHGITPKTTQRAVSESWLGEEEKKEKKREKAVPESSLEELDRQISACRAAMKEAAKRLEFEEAAHLRDELKRLERAALGLK